MNFVSKQLEKATLGPSGGKLRLVVLDCAYNTFESSGTQSLFSKVIAMKIAGYRKHYPYGVLPADSYDFVATHMLLCEEKNGELDPLMGMKFTTYEKCKTHNLEFPIFHIVDQKYHEHHQAVEDTVNGLVAKGESVAYSASWTMSEKVRRDPRLTEFCKYLNIALFYYYKETFGIQNVVDGATVRFKIEKWKAFLGYEPFQYQGAPLGQVPCDPFFGEMILLMHLKKFTAEAVAFARQFDYLWEQRLVIAADPMEQKIAA